jgi:hypothetical protein
MFTKRAFSVGIIAEPTTGLKQPGRADRQRSPLLMKRNLSRS